VILLKPVFPVLQYAVNYEYISKVLCVNKEKPQMHCNGKCHLMKELAKAAEKETPISSDKKNSHFEIEVLFLSPLPQYAFFGPINQSRPEINPGYPDLYEYLNVKTSFHPPAFFS
jgi:hypothetical protein